MHEMSVRPSVRIHTAIASKRLNLSPSPPGLQQCKRLLLEDQSSYWVVRSHHIISDVTPVSAASKVPLIDYLPSEVPNTQPS